MELSIIILSYKMKRLVGNCIRSLRESGLSLAYEIIVVDNASHDGIEEYLKAEFPDIRLIVSPENHGMGAGNNLGIKAARGKYVVILNPDIFFLENTIEKMYNYMKQNQRCGILAPRLLNPDRSLQPTCYHWHGLLTPLYRRSFLGKTEAGEKHLQHFLMANFDHETVAPVDWCQGSFLMAPRELLNQLNGFDEKFFMYFEDTDLCRRVAEAGYQVVYFGSSPVIHLHLKMSAGGLVNIFTNKLTREHIKSWFKYFWKHYQKKIK